MHYIASKSKKFVPNCLHFTTMSSFINVRNQPLNIGESVKSNNKESCPTETSTIFSPSVRAEFTSDLSNPASAFATYAERWQKQGMPLEVAKARFAAYTGLSPSVFDPLSSMNTKFQVNSDTSAMGIETVNAKKRDRSEDARDAAKDTRDGGRTISRSSSPDHSRSSDRNPVAAFAACWEHWRGRGLPMEIAKRRFALYSGLSPSQFLPPSSTDVNQETTTVQQDPQPAKRFVIDSHDVDIEGEHLPRAALVDELHNQLMNSRFVHVGAGAGTGKTALFNLYARRHPEVNCIYLRLLENISANQQLLNIGVDMPHRTVLPSSICGDVSKPCVILLDDAHEHYHDESFWDELIKGDVPGFKRLPKHIHFAIAATSTLPILRNLRARGLTSADFELSREEVGQFLNFNFTDSPVGDVLHDPTVKATLAESCGWMVGVLSNSVRTLLHRFHGTLAPTVEEVVVYVNSDEFLQEFNRCFGEVPDISESLHLLLREVYEEGSAPFSLDLLDTAGIEGFKRLVVRSMVILDREGDLRFSCPLAARFMQNHHNLRE